MCAAVFAKHMPKLRVSAAVVAYYLYLFLGVLFRVAVGLLRFFGKRFYTAVPTNFSKKCMRGIYCFLMRLQSLLAFPRTSLGIDETSSFVL